jgi:photosystem II stability/assembly factor-like uncharacterized protein
VLDPTDSGIMYVGGRAGIQKTVDGGQTWQVMNEGLATTNIRTIVMSPLDPHTLFAGTNGSGLYRSSDSAKTWVRMPLIAKDPAAAPAGR